MGLEFSFRNFAFPVAIPLLKHRFNRNQWLNKEAFEEEQLTRLRETILHCERHVPYYRKLLAEHDVRAKKIESAEDICALPCLTKDALRLNFEPLTADNAQLFRPQKLTTSGTTGTPLEFYVDKNANVQEFVYYWRLWGWFGYRLGSMFAELSAEAFRNSAGLTHKFIPLERRLLLNSLLLGAKNSARYLELLRRFRPRFLKGLPSNLYILALLCREHREHGLHFDAVFSQGETLPPHYRRVIEETFSTTVVDSYGHLERTAAISQCPAGAYHVHSDYGFTELHPCPAGGGLPAPADGEFYAEVIGTSLYNRAMPLLRYRTGDIVRVKRDCPPCSCGRTFPVVEEVLGRSVDIVITPDRRAVTALYLAFHRTPGLLMARAVQENLHELHIYYSCAAEEPTAVEARLSANVRDIVNHEMRLILHRRELDELRRQAGPKFRNVISKLSVEELF